MNTTRVRHPKFKIAERLAHTAVDLDTVQLEVLLQGMSLATKDVNVPSHIGASSTATINLRFGLTDNEAAMAPNYGGGALILQMGVRANFRTHHGLVPLKYDVRIRTILYK